MAAQTAPEGEGRTERLDSASVVTSRATRVTPIAYTTVRAPELRAADPQGSLPMTLAAQPSVVSTNEGGTGLGYSKLNIRGVSGSQTNVTLNGITLNDAESQEVFWVNIPAIASFLGSVQLQRGLGTSNNGPGAFGASINMNTASAGDLPAAQADYSIGAFNTRTKLVSAASGLLPRGFFLQAAVSKQDTDGYLRGAWADVRSGYVALGWMNARNALKLTVLHGSQHTGITWEGIPKYIYDAGHADFNPAGARYDTSLYGSADEAYMAGAIDSYYKNQSDNYRQTHVQLSWSHAFRNLPLTWATTLNYTDGYGYYEQLMLDFLAPGTDAVTRDILDNSLWVGRTALQYSGSDWKLEGGLYLSHYDGLHLGKTLTPKTELYRNKARKPEVNGWLRGEWTPGTATLYSDLQLRGIHYHMDGPDEMGVTRDYHDRGIFVNPRIGFTLPVNERHKTFASVSFGHREPARSDLQSAAEFEAVSPAGTKVRYPKPEKMLDLEAGYEFRTERFSATANLYAMEYFDMLIETGEINFAGYTIKDNTPRAWRRGFELALGWKAAPWLKLDGNLTLSTNKIREYTSWLDNYDATWTLTPPDPSNPAVLQVSESHRHTDILMSPRVTGFASACAKAWKNGEISAQLKFVGAQYWDNTSCADRRIPAYEVLNLSVSQRFPLRNGELYLGGYVGNVLNRTYYANAWVWRAVVDGSPVQSEGIYPQAPIHWTLRIGYRF